MHVYDLGLTKEKENRRRGGGVGRTDILLKIGRPSCTIPFNKSNQVGSIRIMCQWYKYENTRKHTAYVFFS